MAPFYTVKETAQILGFSTNTVYKYLDQGRLKGTRGSAVQGRFRISQSQLDSFLGHRLDSSSEPINQLTNQLSSGALPLLPIKIIRILLILSLIFIVVELFLNNDFSLKETLFRLVIVSIFVVLAYQFISFNKKT